MTNVGQDTSYKTCHIFLWMTRIVNGIGSLARHVEFLSICALQEVDASLRARPQLLVVAGPEAIRSPVRT